MPRSRKPAEQTRADGNPREHAIPNPLDIGDALHDVPDPPEHLGSIARHVWTDLAQQLVDVGSLRTSDLYAFELMCEAFAQARLAMELLQSAGLTDVGSKGQRVAHPAVGIWKGAQAEFRMWCNRFGLDPSSRTARGADADEDDGGSEDVVPLEVVSGGG